MSTTALVILTHISLLLPTIIHSLQHVQIMHLHMHYANCSLKLPLHILDDSICVQIRERGTFHAIHKQLENSYISLAIAMDQPVDYLSYNTTKLIRLPRPAAPLSLFEQA